MTSITLLGTMAALVTLLIGYGLGYSRAVVLHQRRREARDRRHDAAFAESLRHRKARDLGALIHPRGHPCYSYPSISRDAIAERAGLTVNAACGRLAPSGPLLLPKGQDDGPWAVRAVEDAATSAAGHIVTGYQLSIYGLALVEESHRAVA